MSLADQAPGAESPPRTDAEILADVRDVLRGIVGLIDATLAPGLNRAVPSEEAPNCKHPFLAMGDKTCGVCGETVAMQEA